MRRRRLHIFLAPALALVLLAGCGSSGKSTSSSSTGSASTASTPSTASTAGKPAASPAEVKAATEECKRIVASTAQLTQGAKEKLEGACAEAAKGNLAKVKEVAKEVCEEVVDKNSSKLPGSAKEKALAACRKT
jgi:hypothetical protein